jgi:diguanylate cyclase (GGDEF)-like protein/PAS domain S-box-containing protein
LGILVGGLVVIIISMAVLLIKNLNVNLEMKRLLAEEEKRFKSLFVHNPDPVLSFDLTGRITSINPEALKSSGYTSAELLSMNFAELLVPKEVNRVNAIFQQVVEGASQNYETSYIDKSGKMIEINVKSMPIFKKNQVTGVFSIIKDVTESNKSNYLLDSQTRVLEMIAKGNTLKEILTEINIIFERVSSGGICSILVVDESRTRLLTGAAISLPDEYNQFINGTLIGEKSGSCGAAAYYKKQIFVENIATDPLWSDYSDHALKYGLKACWSTPILDNDNEILGTFAIYYHQNRLPQEKDIKMIDKATYLARLAILHFSAEQKVKHMAFHDSLTGLANRRLFNQKFKQALFDARDKNTEIGLLFLDLDRFKVINDSLGHSMGDLLLQKVANRLRLIMDEKNAVCRQGGDEFLILLEDVSLEDIIQAATDIIDALAQPIRLKDHDVIVTPSIGISRFPYHGDDLDTLVKHADAAMYEAKKKGKNNYQFYTNEHGLNSNDQLELEQYLRKAIKFQELVLYYQPIIDVKSRQINGVEALIRWMHPKLGFIAPHRFIPLAEETGLIVSIGEWVLRTACKTNQAWQWAGLPPVVMSVNLSIRQFFQPDLIAMIKGILEETGLEPCYLEIEITESMTMNIDSAIEIIDQLKQLGVKVAIDDFGTGYSSLNYLKRLPIDRLKIDQSFVNDIEKDSNDRDIVATIITIGHNLKMKVIAEGVESEEQLQFLNNLGCDDVQGYLFSKPLAEEEFVHHFKAVTVLESTLHMVK